MSNDKSLMVELVLSPKDFMNLYSKLWMDSETLGKKIGFDAPRRSVNMIYNRNLEELKPFTCKNKLFQQGQHREILLFDSQACYMVAMFAKTPKAKQFRLAICRFLLEAQRTSMENQLIRITEKYPQIRESHFKQIYLASSHVSLKDLAMIYQTTTTQIKKILNLYPNLYRDELSNKDIWTTVTEQDMLHLSDVQRLLLTILSRKEKPGRIKLEEIRSAASLVLSGLDAEKVAQQSNFPVQTIQEFINLRSFGQIAGN